ncbi:hypothetical protein ACSAZK_10045 [Methanosarcina sp. Mfa9]
MENEKYKKVYYWCSREKEKGIRGNKKLCYKKKTMGDKRQSE